MMNPFKDPNDLTAGGPPFVLELRREAERTDGRFTPAAAVLVTEALRASGLVRQLDPIDLQTLLLVLSCVTANGTFVASAETLAQAMGTSAHRMAGRLRRLTALHWREGPLLFNHRSDSGLSMFHPSGHLFEVKHAGPLAGEGAGGPFASDAEYQAAVSHALQARREAVIAHSRATYGRPRAEVEAQIERFLRNEPEATTPEEQARLVLRRRIMHVGLTFEQADRLLDGYPANEIEDQLEWLPLRQARNPAGFLLAAIEGRYEAPPGVRRLASHEGVKEIEGAIPVPPGGMVLPVEEFLDRPGEAENAT